MLITVLDISGSGWIHTDPDPGKNDTDLDPDPGKNDIDPDSDQAKNVQYGTRKIKKL